MDEITSIDLISNYTVKQIIKDVDGTRVVFNTPNGEVVRPVNESSFKLPLEEGLEKNPGEMTFWGGVAHQMVHQQDEAELIIKGFTAYCKKYIKMYLKGKNEKDTIDGRDDAFYTVYGKNVELKERRLAGIMAYKGYCEEVKQPLSNAEWQELSQWVILSDTKEISCKVREFADFYVQMMQPISANMYYDDLMKKFFKLKEAVGTIVAIAGGYRSFSFSLKSLVELKRGERGVAPGGYEDSTPF